MTKRQSLADRLKNLLAFDIHDLGVMIGAAFFCNAVVSLLMKWAVGSPPGHTATLLIAFLAFLAGGLLSQHVRRKQQLSQTTPSLIIDKEVTEHDNRNERR